MKENQHLKNTYAKSQEGVWKKQLKFGRKTQKLETYLLCLSIRNGVNNYQIRAQIIIKLIEMGQNIMYSLGQSSASMTWEAQSYRAT